MHRPLSYALQCLQKVSSCFRLLPIVDRLPHHVESTSPETRHYQPVDGPSGLENDGLAELKALGNIIATSIGQIEDALKAASLPFPSLRTPYTPELEAARNLSEVVNASAFITAAASQLVATVRAPFVHVTTTAMMVRAEYHDRQFIIFPHICACSSTCPPL